MKIHTGEGIGGLLNATFGNAAELIIALAALRGGLHDVVKAAGGVACTGSTGEDYVVPGQNALVLETADPWEFVTLFRELRANPARERALRRAGRVTAEHYSWPRIVRRLLLPRLHFMTKPLPFGKLRPA